MLTIETELSHNKSKHFVCQVSTKFDSKVFNKVHQIEQKLHLRRKWQRVSSASSTRGPL